MDHDPSVLFSNLEADLAPYSYRQSGKYLAPSELDTTVGHRTAAANHLLNSVLKKFKDGTSPDADAKAVRKFLSANKGAGEWSLGPQLTSWLDELAWGELRRVWYEFTHGGECQTSSFHMPNWKLGVGPGSNVGARDVDYYTKVWDSPLSATSEGLYDTYAMYVRQWYGPDFHGETIREQRYGHQIVGGCKLVCVPKNVDISRVIFVEPTLNMMFQQGLRDQLESRLVQVYGINIRRQQEVNRALAGFGSEYWEYKLFDFATIDLESASDWVSLNLLEALSAPGCELLAMLKAFRSPKAVVDGTEVTLNMVGTMGNATTFPLETAVFAAICRTAIRLTGGGYERAETRAQYLHWSGVQIPAFTVFGDDIVVPNRAVGLTLRLLRICGFKVNSRKSFLEGPFKESCGRDYYKGHDIRGVHIEDLDGPQSLCKAFNRLAAWSVRHDIPLKRTLRGLFKALKGKGVGLVPLWESVDAGLRIPTSFIDSWDNVGDDSILDGRQKRLLVNNFVLPSLTKGSFIWRYKKYEPVEKLARLVEDAVVAPHGSPLRTLNSAGVLDARLAGHIRVDKWSIRENDPTYRQRFRVALNWEYPSRLEADSLPLEPRAPVGKVFTDPPPFLVSYAELYEAATQDKDALGSASEEAMDRLLASCIG